MSEQRKEIQGLLSAIQRTYDEVLDNFATGGEIRRHWLIFNDAREVVGCHCGVAADAGDEGYGDSIVAHLIDVGRDELQARRASTP